MAEKPILSDWLEKSRAKLASTELVAEAEAIGRVVHMADGIARISGLPDASLGALLRFEGERYGFAQALGRDAIDAVILDDATAIEAGDKVADTGEVLHVPVGETLLGRIVDPLGRPLDGKEPVKGDTSLPVERAAPTIIERDLVSEPVETGILVLDSLFALGRGQRELIVGDRATGKTSLAVDAIINQKDKDVFCIYVAIGQRATAVERVIAAVREYGNPERCIFVVSAAASPPGLQWLAPFAGMTMAEYFRDRGEHVLIVFDDLTRHAATHRELSLLTREPPGREAYPGDIFYLHARLLERAAKLAPEKGGGSITALPVAEIEANNLSAYIPTNLISITDGQIVLNSHLFANNQRPAVDVGLSVSRVGGKAQVPAFREVSGKVRLEYAQFQELELFTRFGGISGDHVRSQIARGERIRAMLNQPRYSGLRTVDQVAFLAALSDGALDALPPGRIPLLRQRLPRWLDAHATKAVGAMKETGGITDETRAMLVGAVASLVRELCDGVAAGAGNE